MTSADPWRGGVLTMVFKKINKMYNNDNIGILVILYNKRKCLIKKVKNNNVVLCVYRERDQ